MEHICSGDVGMSDRTVHARLSDGSDIVRYERAGKWYIEYPARSLMPRQQIGIETAVKLVKRDRGSRHFPNLPGGSAFDRKMESL